FDSGPVSAPATGALLGAWVRPAVLNQAGRVQAVRDLERALGRQLAIVNTYRRFDDPFPTASDRAFAAAGATLMLSWVIDDTRVISSGALDPRLHDWARRIRDLGGPVLLRLRWEMDRPNLAASMWSGPDYVAAWKHVRAIFAQEQVDNVSWAWCPTAEGFAGGYAPAFYPGDAQVDWVCVDVYAGSRLRSLGDLLRPFLTWAAAHPKPIVLGEFGVAEAWGEPARTAWLAGAVALVRANPQIKAACYFDSNPDGNAAAQRFQLDGSALAAFTKLARLPYFNPR
ncbi:MAG TPA: glycosyl hydrolase, partial [Rugosimonospora sp.]|nr:glycosyl hydrolase [Rugosimonospora sp.]